MWRFRMLGSLEVDVDGNPVALPAPKHRALLLLLLLNNGRLCSTDRLIEDLWDRPPASAGKILQAYISHLRSLLGAHAIESMPTGYRLHVDPATIDTNRFEQLLDRARECRAAGEHLLAGALGVRALALWRGTPLADVAYRSFAQREIARLEELHLQCIEVRIDAELASGQHDRAIADLLALCQSHPEREPFHERLALAQYRSGRQSDALTTIAAARRHLTEDLGLDPGRRLRELEHAILVQDPDLDAPAALTAGVLGPVPVPDSELVGRQRELDDLLTLLIHDGLPLVTITGPGGSGKTRLAREVARRARPFFAHGVAFVEFASINDPTLVNPTVAQALGLTETATQPAEQVVAQWLRSRQVLIVIDTFEHLADAAAQLSDLLQDAPHVSVLVTSRRALDLRVERVSPLDPLPIDDAARLLADRARARDPRNLINPDDEAVRDICTRLDCLPLALEIAAARVSAVGAPALRDRLRADLGALGSGPRDAPARQQTLADTVRWTAEQLTPAERCVFARLSAFVGGCNPAAAGEVCEADLETLRGLVEWSLVGTTGSPPAVRFTMPDTIRHHAAALADEIGERSSAEHAHARHHLQLAEALFTLGSSQPERLRALDPELDNLRVAYDRAMARDDRDTALRLSTALYPYWYVRGLYREGRDRVETSLSGWTPDLSLLARACRVLASMHYLLGDDERADDVARRGIEVGMQLTDRYEAMACHTVRGVVAQRRGDLTHAREHIRASGDLARAMGRELDVIIAETNLGDIELAAGVLEEARAHFEAAHDFHRARGSDASFALIGLGSVARRQRRLDDAERHLGAARADAMANDRHQNVVLSELGLAAIHRDRGDLAQAARALGALRSILEELDIELHGGDLDEHLEIEAALLAEVGPDQLAAWMREGRDAPPLYRS